MNNKKKKRMLKLDHLSINSDPIYRSFDENKGKTNSSMEKNNSYSLCPKITLHLGLFKLDFDQLFIFNRSTSTI